MTRTLPSLLLAVVVLTAACSSGESTDPPRPSPVPTSTTTTVAPTTTTTIRSLRIEGAPRGLAVVVGDFYEYASGETTSPPPAPDPVVAAITPGELDLPTRGTAETGVFAGQRLAVVEIGSDVLLAVADDAGWRIVGGEWPSLSVPGYFGETPRHVVVVGSDARPGQDVDSSRADSIHFVALDGKGGARSSACPETPTFRCRDMAGERSPTRCHWAARRR